MSNTPCEKIKIPVAVRQGTFRTYRNDIQPYRDAAMVESNCNSITFVNRGAAQAIINGYPINAGEQIIFSGEKDEMDITRYQISFTTAGNKLIYVFRKLYTV